MTMELSDLQAKFMDEIRYVDDLAQIVLKGHLVIEDLLNKALGSFFIHGDLIDNARLQFHQKLELCKAISVSEHQNNVWNLVKKINVLRNALSHSLDSERREKALQGLKAVYDQEFGQSSRKFEGMDEETALCITSITGVLGFLHSFLSEVERFETLVKSLDGMMNKKD